jgi:DNA processing protein
MSLPPIAYSAAVATLDKMTPHRLRMILRHWSPEEAWHATISPRPDPWLLKLCSRGEGGMPPREWSNPGGRLSPDVVWERCQATNTQVLSIDDPLYPACLSDDRFAPAVIFARGDLAALDHRRVGMVGTRNATVTGRNLARRLGYELAEKNITVVSGLAKGIDGFAHRGAIDAAGAPPVAIVASGPDHPFPKEHAGLWEEVIERGLLISEHSPGAPPIGEWFPLRNRVIAALSEVLVVVESREKGGSMITVREAISRNVTVMAVPGSLTNFAAAGTNRLLADGAIAALEVADILVALGLDTRRTKLPFDPRPMPTGTEREVLEAFAGDTLSIEEVIGRTDLDLIAAAVSIGRLEASGWLRSSGAWFEAVGVRELVR